LNNILIKVKKRKGVKNQHTLPNQRLEILVGSKQLPNLLVRE